MKRLRLSAVIVAALLLAAVPATSGAWTASLKGSATAATAAPYFACSDAYAVDKAKAAFQWPMTDAAGAGTTVDVSGSGDTGSFFGASVAADAATPIACPADGGTGRRFNGTDDKIQESAANRAAPGAFTIEAWFRTTKSSAWIIGFGSARYTSATSAGSTTYRDRVLYIDKNGSVDFAVYTSAGLVNLVSTPVVTDGAWHHAAATLGTTGGATLYVDGQVAAGSPTTKSGIGYDASGGAWHVGFDSIATTGGVSLNVSSSSNGYFAGSMRWVAAYTSELPASSIRAHAAAGAVAH